MITSKKSPPKKTNLKTRVIAIDGPAGAGKSTVAKLLAKRLGFLYLDTGAMYRAATLAAIKKKVNFSDTAKLIKIASKSKIDLKNISGNLNVYLNEKIVNRSIRRPQVNSLVSSIAPIREIREIMVKKQRKIGQRQNCVMEGRDIGTVVFPDAFIKFYLDASLSERARRRCDELKEKNIANSPLKEVELSIKERDKNDLTRRFGPLKKAKDAIYVDTTNLTISEVVRKLLTEIQKRLNG
ncbi:MAG: (d)CMP kinase [Candidatus Omnitrophota bacterium]